MEETTYIYLLTQKDRKRHRHLREKGTVVSFVVQYETYLEDRWHPVIRYDTSHGLVHIDRLHPDGSKEKIFLGILNLKEALVLADQDIDENWQRYKEKYLKEAGYER